MPFSVAVWWLRGAGVFPVMLALSMLYAAEDARQPAGWPTLWQSPPPANRSESPTAPAESADEIAPSRPLRVLELINGETLYVELLRVDREMLEFRWHGRNRMRIPWDRVSRIGTLPGVVDVLDESFEVSGDGGSRDAYSGRQSLKLLPPSPPFRYQFPPDLTSGRVRWMMRTEAGATGRITLPCGAAALDIRSTSETATLELPAGWECSFRQSLPPGRGWMVWSCSWGDGRWCVQRGRSVLATGTAAELPAAIQFHSDSQGAVWIDDLHVQRLVRPPVPAIAGLQATPFAVDLLSGDTLYGDWVSGPGQSWSLRRNERLIPLAWSECTAIRRREIEAGRPSAWLSGAVVRVSCAAPDWPPGLPDEVWMGAVRNRSGGLIHAVHSLLGEVALAETEVRNIDHQGSSQWIWLWPGRVHLGDEVRGEFQRPLPDGHNARGTFELPRQPRGRWRLSLTVADLEPSGKSTPPSQPYRDVLEQGGLRTELFLNGRFAGDLNSALTCKPPINHPERVRLTIPTEFLKTGENVWEIRQRPLSALDPRYDDCELGRIALEREQ